MINKNNIGSIKDKNNNNRRVTIVIIIVTINRKVINKIVTKQIHFP